MLIFGVTKTIQSDGILHDAGCQLVRFFTFDVLEFIAVTVLPCAVFDCGHLLSGAVHAVCIRLSVETLVIVFVPCY